MKKFKFTIAGEIFEVSITGEHDTNTAEVVVNGTPYTVEFEREDASASKQVITTPRATTAPRTNSANVSSRKAAAPVVPPPPAAKKAGNEKSVKSPLPGSIFKIPVSVGQAVKRGDQLVIIESMKMENSILADKDGTVKAIYVQIGQSVLQGDALVDLD